MNDVATRWRLKVRIVHKTNIPKKRNEPASTPVRPVSKKKHFLHVNPFKVLMDEKNTDGDVQRREDKLVKDSFQQHGIGTTQRLKV